MERLMDYAEKARLWREEYDILCGISKFSHVVHIPDNGVNVEVEGVEIVPQTEKILIASAWVLACYLRVRGLTQHVFEGSSTKTTFFA